MGFMRNILEKFKEFLRILKNVRRESMGKLNFIKES